MAQTGFTPIQIYHSTTPTNTPSAGDLVDGELAINTADGKLFYKDSGGSVQTIATTAGANGDVVGPASATDNAIVRFDGTTGKLVQNSAATVADTTGDITAGAYNKVTITAPATGSTLTIADGKTLTANSSLTLAGVDAKTLTVNNSLTLAGTDATTMTFPATSATIARTDAGQTFTGTQTVLAAATQDAVALAGRAGGTGSFVATLTPTTLSASRTVTLPDENTTIPVASQVLTFTGPSAARTITLPDANFTAARTDAAQTFTGTQTFSGAVSVQGNTTLGDASTDTVTVNGYMGVGGAGNSAFGIRAGHTSLTGTAPVGIGSIGIAASNATASYQAFYATAGTAAAAFTCSDVSGYRVTNAVKGAGSTITNQHGLLIDDLLSGTNNFGITSLVSSGTNKWNIYASGTAANYFAGNVGIGTSSPNYRLEAYQSNPARGIVAQLTNSAASGQTGSQLAFLQNGIDWWTIGQPAGTSAFAIWKSRYNGGDGTEIARFDSSGNLGLGVAPSAWGGGAKVLQFTNGGAIGSEINGYLTSTVNAVETSSGNWVYISSGLGAARQRISYGSYQWYTAPSGTAGNAITFTERASIGLTEMVVNEPGADYDFRVESDTNTHALFVEGSSGNVGIGTTSPNAKLHVQDASAPRFYLGTETAKFAGLVYSAGTTYGSVAIRGQGNDTGTVVHVDRDNSQVRFDTGGTERLRITNAGNVSIGGTADRATTVGTKALNIFDGTAPVGTLTNGISIYSSSGEAYVMDAAGNATLFSPHDAETNEWIFKSKHTPTGKVLRIDVEKLLRFVNDHFGLDAVQEFIEP